MSKNTLRILLVDSEPTILEVFREGLEAVIEGCEITSVQEEKIAIQQLLHDDFDIVVLDLSPQINALECVSQLRQCGKKTPVIVWTGYMPRQMEESLRKMDVVECLLKPVDLEHLSTIIKKYTDYLGLESYPDPFSGSTAICYSVVASRWVRLDVFDLTGQRIKSLINGRQSCGMREIPWDGTNDRGKVVATGTYLAKLQIGDVIHVRKMVLTK